MPTQQQINVKADRLRDALRQEARYLGTEDGNYRVLMDMVDADSNTLARLYDLIQRYGTKGAALASLEGKALPFTNPIAGITPPNS